MLLPKVLQKVPVGLGEFGIKAKKNGKETAIADESVLTTFVALVAHILENEHSHEKLEKSTSLLACTFVASDNCNSSDLFGIQLSFFYYSDFTNLDSYMLIRIV